MRSLAVLLSFAALTLAASCGDETVLEQPPATGGSGGAAGGGGGGDPDAGEEADAAGGADDGGAGAGGEGAGGAGGASGGGGEGGSGGVGPCESDDDCQDASYCNGFEVCKDGVCGAGDAVVCNDGVPCTIDTCSDASASCTFVPNHTKCLQGQICDPHLGCQGLAPCTANAECDDKIPCTLDSCDDLTGYCVNEPSDAECDDGLFCNGAETCTLPAGCTSPPSPCDDGIGCTVEQCTEPTDTCAWTPDDKLCPEKEMCDVSAGCIPVDCTLDKHCDDGVDCTLDTCDLTTHTCVHVPGDQDGDGFNGLECGGTDCDDTNPAIKPGASETCNGADDDCDGTSDEGYTFARDFGSQVVQTGAYPPFTAALAYKATPAPARYAMAWQVSGGAVNVATALFFQTLDEGGSPQAAPTNPEPETYRYGLQLQHDGSQWVVTYTVQDNYLFNTHIARVNDQGLVQGSIAAPNQDPGNSVYPSLARHVGGTHTLSFLNLSNNSVTIKKLDGNFAPVGKEKIVHLSNVYYPNSIAAGPEKVASVVMIDHNGMRRFRRIDDGVLDDEVLFLGNYKLELSDQSQLATQQIVWTGTEWGVVWQHRANDPDKQQLVLGRVSPDGTKILGVHKLTTDLTANVNPPLGDLLPALTWTGSYYIVTWAETGAVKALRVSARGKPAGAPFTVSISGESPGSSCDAFAPQVAWTGSRLGVLWGKSAAPSGIIFARINPCAPAP